MESRIPAKLNLQTILKRKGAKAPIDPKVAKVMTKIDITDINDFRKQSSVTAVANLKQCLANSTMEDYTWRVIRQLKGSGLPASKISPYESMWKDYGGVPKSKKKPSGNPRGRPPGRKNTC